MTTKVGNLSVTVADNPPVVISNATLKKQIASVNKSYTAKIKKTKAAYAKKIKAAKTKQEKAKLKKSLLNATKRIKDKQKKAVNAKKNAQKKSKAKKAAYEFNEWLAGREAYEIWLTHDAEKEKIQLPVNPESLTVKSGSKNTTVDIVGLGEITIMNDRPALRFSFKSFFPAGTFPGVQVEELETPIELANTIQEWKSSKTAVHFIVPGLAINLYCTIETFDYFEVGGDIGTLQYTMALQEYREAKMRKVTVKNNKIVVNKGANRNNNKKKPKTYKVKKGDTLYKIAKKIYGDGAKKTKIYNANKKKIPNKNKLKVGVVLKIP